MDRTARSPRARRGIPGPAANPSREDEADRALKHTVLTPGVALGLIGGFLLTIGSVPVLQHVVELRRNLAVGHGPGSGPGSGHRRIWPQCYDILDTLPRPRQVWAVRSLRDAVHLFPTRPAIKAYENTLEDHSVLSEWVRPRSQYVLTRWLGAGNERVCVGRHGWLFYRPDVDYLVGRGFLDESRISPPGRVPDGAPPNPVNAIRHFHQQLAARGIELVVMPVPVKPAIELEMLAARVAARQGPLENPSDRRFRAILETAGIRVFDVSDLLMAAKRTTGRAQYLRTDTHWSPAAMEAAARGLAEFITARVPVPCREPVGYTRRPAEVTQVGDLARMLNLPGSQGLFPAERVRVHQVCTPDGALWRPRRDSDILVLGDSFSANYSVKHDGWGEAAGLAEQLSLALQRPIDQIAVNGGGAGKCRQRLADDLARGDDHLAGKRLVIYEFAMRELTVPGDWRLIDLGSGIRDRGKGPARPSGPVENSPALRVLGRRLPRPVRPGGADEPGLWYRLGCPSGAGFFGRSSLPSTEGAGLFSAGPPGPRPRTSRIPSPDPATARISALWHWICYKSRGLGDVPSDPVQTGPVSGRSSLALRIVPGTGTDVHAEERNCRWSREDPRMVLLRSQLDRLTEPASFLWATGIEDTFITDPWPATGRTLDEYDLTGHYEQWSEDLALMAELGVRTARYGIPWHRVNPAKDRWDWTWADRPLERLLELGIDPIVDLVHYGLPRWIDGAFLDPDFPRLLGEYAGRLADRFRNRIRWYTPLNEPRITAWYCGKLGWWPPGRRGWRGFVQVMLGLGRGIVRADGALRSVDPEIVLVHVDATDVYSSPDPALRADAERYQDIGFLALDLVGGRVDEEHPLWSWLLDHGAAEADLAWFQDHAVAPDLVGLNLYPMFSQKRLVRSPRGLRTRMSYGSSAMVERLVDLYWWHYGRPLMITETAARGARRRAWLDHSVAAVRRLRERGVPLVGYTWWPMFALVAWAYRQGTRPVGDYLEQMGLWDLDPGPAGELRRRRTPLVDAYRALAAGGAAAVGPLAHRDPDPR